MNHIEAMKQWLEALERSVATCFDQYSHQQVMSQPDHFINQAITSLRQAIAEAEKQVFYSGNGTAGGENTIAPTGFFFQMPKESQEPVGWIDRKGNMLCVKINESCRPLYTHPQPKREWVGLTDEETQTCWDKAVNTIAPQYSIVRAIEAKLKEKNT